MKGTPALVITHDELLDVLEEIADRTAAKAVENLKTELRTDPNERVVEQLRAYLEDRSTQSNPRDVWAHSGHIRYLELNRTVKGNQNRLRGIKCSRKYLA